MKAIAPEQIPFILAGKWYLLARTLYQIIVLAWFAWLTRSNVETSMGWTGVGAALMLSGVACRAWAMSVLGERFRGFEVRQEVRGLETGGPYALIRHPGYLALALTDVGMPLLLSVPQLAVLALVPLSLMLRRITLEEALLRATYANSYAGYASRTSRLLPRIY